MKTNIKMKGRWCVEKYDTAAFLAGGPPKETVELDNALVNAGRQRFLDRTTGVSTATPLDANSVLRIAHTSPSGTTTLASLSAGYPQHNLVGTTGASIVLRWVDSSTNTYTPTSMQVWYSGNSIQLSSTGVSFGSKPSNETWTYTWTLTLESGVDSFLSAEGVDRMCRIVTNVYGFPYNIPNTRLEVRSDTDIGCQAGVLIASLSPDSVPVRTDQTVRWTFVTTSGQGDWQCYAVTHVGSPTVDLRRGPFISTTPGTQPSNNERTVHYDLTLL